MLLFDFFYIADRIYVGIAIVVMTISIVAYYKKHFRQRS
jgi:hypothetical protein